MQMANLDPQWIPVLIVSIIGIAGTTIAVTAIITVQRRKDRASERAAHLIQDMLAHNMSSDEISQLMDIWTRGGMGTEELIQYTKAVEKEKRKRDKSKPADMPLAPAKALAGKAK